MPISDDEKRQRNREFATLRLAADYIVRHARGYAAPEFAERDSRVAGALYVHALDHRKGRCAGMCDVVGYARTKIDDFQMDVADKPPMTRAEERAIFRKTVQPAKLLFGLAILVLLLFCVVAKLVGK